MLGELLAGLDKQTYRPFEVLVIDDGSTDGSGSVAQSAAVADHPVRVLTHAASGALESRRVGVEKAQGSLLAFIDSDCVPDQRWLESAVAAVTEGADMVHGSTRPMRPLRPLERSVASGTEGLFPTCNVVYTRDLYDRLGGFDELAAQRWRFRPGQRAQGLGFGEDTLLGWRAVRSGADVRYAPAAVVEHQVFAPDFGDLVSRTAQVAAFPAMIKEIPELRRTLVRHRVFLGDLTRVPLYLTLAAVALRRPLLTRSALVCWIALRAHRLRRSPHPTLPLLPWLPAEMAMDAATAGALVLGSVRSRTLVL
jgi:hypothetical protein